MLVSLSDRFCGRNASALQALTVEAKSVTIEFKSDTTHTFTGFKLSLHITSEKSNP